MTRRLLALRFDSPSVQMIEERMKSASRIQDWLSFMLWIRAMRLIRNSV